MCGNQTLIAALGRIKSYMGKYLYAIIKLLTASLQQNTV